MSAAEKKPAKKDDGKNSNRGTSDELEVLVMIINENIAIKGRVMEKIRAVREEKARRDARAEKKSTEPT